MKWHPPNGKLIKRLGMLGETGDICTLLINVVWSKTSESLRLLSRAWLRSQWQVQNDRPFTTAIYGAFVGLNKIYFTCFTDQVKKITLVNRKVLLLTLKWVSLVIKVWLGYCTSIELHFRMIAVLFKTFESTSFRITFLLF